MSQHYYCHFFSTAAPRLLVSFLFLFHDSWGFVPKAVQEQWKAEGYNLQDAIKTIEECAEQGQNTDELYYAVRYIDRNAHILYSKPEERQALWEKAKGSWELRLAYEDSRDQYFFPYPDFREYALAYCMIEEDYFGKGICQNNKNLFPYVTMAGPAEFNNRKRQFYMNYEDFYISGNLMPDWDLSYFMRGYARNWYSEKRKRPPLAFTLIAASDKVLCVRGSKTGGMAILQRMTEDMCPSSYGR